MIYIIIGLIVEIIIACVFVFARSAKQIDIVKKPALDAELTPAQAIQQLQHIKPYFAYKGRTWTALDMAIKAIQGEAEEWRD